MTRGERFMDNYRRQGKIKHTEGALVVKLASEEVLSALRDAGFRLGKPLGFGGYHKILFHGDTQSAMERLANIEGVENAELEPIPEQDAEFVPNDTHAASQLNYYAMLDVARTWDVYNSYKAKNPVFEQPVSVVDYRFDTQHNDLNLILPGYNSADGGTHVDVRPDSTTYYHGTCCLGLICAKTNNSLGVFGLGLNSPGFPIAASKFEEDGAGDFFVGAIMKSLELGYKVLSISLSWNAHVGYMEDACRYARDNGLIICASAGNDKEKDARWPARYDSVFGIGGLTDSGGVGTTQIHTSANYGPGIDFCGPYATYSTGLDNGYRAFGGTSSATPCVAACAANILSINPGLGWRDVKDIMAASCVRESFQAGDSRGPTLYGHGIPQFAGALEIAMARTTAERAGIQIDGKDAVGIAFATENGYLYAHEAAYGMPDGTLKIIWLPRTARGRTI